MESVYAQVEHDGSIFGPYTAVWVDPVLRPYHNEVTVNYGPYTGQYVTVYNGIPDTVYSTYTRLYFCNIRSVIHRNFIMVRP